MLRVDVLTIFAAILAELGAAFLVAIESAVSRTPNAQAAALAKQGRRGAQSLMAVTADPARYINGLMFVRIGLSVLAVVLIADMLRSQMSSPGWAILLATVVLLVLNFVLLGVAPRTLGRQHAMGLALATAGFVRVLGNLLHPVTKLLILLGNAITPGKGYSEGPFASEAEVRALLEQAKADSVLPATEQQLLDSVIEFGDTICREVMVPRTEMVYIEQDKQLRQALSLSLRSGFTRIPVIHKHLDDVVGIINIKDIAGAVYRDIGALKEPIAGHTRPPLLVPDTKRIDMMLREFQSTRTPMAILVDEYGGTAGLVTSEDILEELVGEIGDEYDRPEIPDCERLADDDYRVSSRMAIEDLAELTGLDLAEDAEEVETVGGLLARRLGVVPIPGSEVGIGGFILTAESAEGRRNRIATVRVRREAAATDEAGPPSDEKVAR